MDVNPSALCSALTSDLVAYFGSQSFRSATDDLRSVQAARAFNLQKSLLEKISDGVVGGPRDVKAFTKWSIANRKCASWEPPTKGASEVDDLLWGELRETVSRFFWRTGDDCVINSLSDLALKGAHGPGASNGVVGTSYYEKSFVGGITTTSEHLGEILRQSYSHLPSYLNAVDYGLSAGGGIRKIEGCHEFYVPKNADISRLAATEPALNMFYQKGASYFLERRLESVYGISLDVQPAKNRRLAQLGSSSGDFSTIDLSSASDSLSLKLVKELLPRRAFDVLARIRSPVMTRNGQEPVELNMFSTMGNGFTFSLQTVIFSCIVHAAYKVCGLQLRKGVKSKFWDPVKGIPDATVDQCGNFAVFGDDIIVETRAFPLVSRLLVLCGCTLNGKKTFVEGPFRESCGGDFYMGHPIRAVSIKLLQTREHVFHAVNSLVDWSTGSGIDLIHTVRYLLSLVGVKDLLYVPPHEQTNAGLHVPLEFFKWSGKDPGRKDPDLGFRFVYKASVPIVKRVRIRFMDIPGGLAFIKLIHPLGRQRGLITNEAGLYQCLLAGHVRNGTWSIRQTDQKFRTSRKVTSAWGVRPGSSVSWMGQWSSTALRHLF